MVPPSSFWLSLPSPNTPRSRSLSGVTAFTSGMMRLLDVRVMLLIVLPFFRTVVFPKLIVASIVANPDEPAARNPNGGVL